MEINFFWGNESMSWLRYMTLKTFCIFHKGWSINLYVYKTSKNNRVWIDVNQQDFFAFKGNNYFSELKKLSINIYEWKLPNELFSKYGDLTPSQASNFFKFSTLGEPKDSIYADLDIIFINNIQPLWDQMVQGGFTNALSFCDYYSVGVLASTKNDKMFKNIYEACLRDFRESVYQGAWSHILNSVHFKNLNGKFGGASFNIDMDYFYKIDSFDIPEIWNYNIPIDDKQMGIHWYAGHPLSQEWNNLLTEENWQNYDNYLISGIKKAYEAAKNSCC